MWNDKVRQLSGREKLTFDQDGVVFLPGLVSGDVVLRLRSEVESRWKNPSLYSSNMSKDGLFYEERNCYQSSEFLKDFVYHSGLNKVAAQTMGASAVRLFMDHLFVCGPNTPTDYYWHQDLLYWPIEGQQVCSIWIALTDCDRSTAALEFVPGTHRGRLYGVRNFGDADDLGDAIKESGGSDIPHYELERERYGVIENDIKAGDAYLFNARVMHASGGNRSKNRTRIAYSLRWVGDDVTWHPRSFFQDDALYEGGKNLKPGDTLQNSGFPLID